LKRNLKDRGMRLACYTPEQVTYPVNNAAESETLRHASISFFKRAAEISSDLDCPYLFVNGGWGEYDRSKSNAWDRAISSLKTIADYAQTLGVCCITESLQPRESNLVLTAKDVKRCINDVGSANMKACLDIVAMAVQKETPTDHFQLYGDSIVHCHFQDGTPSGHLAWGDGELPLAQYLEEFDRFGFSGLFTPELTPSRYALDPTSALNQSVSRMREALGD
ncbi:MAG: TIM barrel protein, partial [Pseudomonadota bacterium]